MSSIVFWRYENTPSCTCGGARAYHKSQGLSTPLLDFFIICLCENIPRQAARSHVTMATSTREADAMKLLLLAALAILAMTGALASWLSIMLGLYPHAMLAALCMVACCYALKKLETFLL